MTTLAEIAKKVGVSPDTVSRVLNRRIATTRKNAILRAERIREAAEELGYKPNYAAQVMGRGRFNAVAMLLGAEQPRHVSSGVLMGALDILEEHDIHLLVERISLDHVGSRGELPAAVQRVASDGLLIHEVRTISEPAAQAIRRSKLPSIWINRRMDADCVYFDNVGATGVGVRHLIEAGHRRIAYVCTEREANPHGSYTERMAAYESAMRLAGLEASCMISPAAEFYSDDTRLSASERIARHLAGLAAQQRPTAILAYDHVVAAAVVAAAARLGWRIPDDLSVVAFGHVPWQVGGQMDLLQLDEQEMGRQAVKTLIRKIESGGQAHEPVCIPVKLHTGASVATVKQSSESDNGKEVAGEAHS